MLKESMLILNDHIVLALMCLRVVVLAFWKAERLLAANNPRASKVNTFFSAVPGKIEGSATPGGGRIMAGSSLAAPSGTAPLPPPPVSATYVVFIFVLGLVCKRVLGSMETNVRGG